MKKTLPLVLLAGLAVVGCNGAKDSASPAVAGEPMVWVNGEPVTKEAFNFHLERRTQGQPQLASPEQRTQLLDELVELTLLAQSAREQKLDADPDIAARIENLRNAVLAQARVEQIAEQLQEDDAALQAEYDQRFGGEQLQEYHARHILVKDEAEAKKLIEQIKGGADFAELAKKHSTDPGSGPNGGDLGWFQADQMVPPFAAAVKAQKPGEVSEQPVQSQFGWHVIQVEETRPMTPPTLDEVRGELAQGMVQKRIQDTIDTLKSKAQLKYAEGVQPVKAAEQAAPAEQAGE